MNIIAKITLFFFIAFLLTPTIVCVLDNSEETSLSFDFSDEEKSDKEIKVIFYSEIIFQTTPLMELVSSLIFYENLSKYDSITSPLYTTPPDLS
jgi:hypothetical protein